MRSVSVTVEQLRPFVGDPRIVVRRLTIDRNVPLYPVSAGHLDTRPKKSVPAGVYEIHGYGEWLLVEADSVRRINEAEALIALGAVRALKDLGLDDAAISLATGDLTNARYQWLRHRDGK
ncbi:MAG: hypothetical protein QM817_22810 [Archangium sp.]